jgi:adenine-specific DNA-methyltransferase
MPTLNWIGKDKVVNHHLDVPFRVLDKQYTFNQPNSGNKIIQGDNLEALKALLPEYEGRVKCIYIDPPYNTGNENWVYNDNVKNPKIKKWLGGLVGKESEDLARHDKWLCMMYPRLQLLHKLLHRDGVIFISIDDNEVSNLKLMCDEIFGSRNYISSLVWRRRASSQMSQNNISVDHEYVVCYFKEAASSLNGIKKDYKNYANPDNDPRGDWTLGDLTVGMTNEQRPNQFYDLVHPENGTIYPANPKRVWTYAPGTMAEKIAEGRVVFPKNSTGQPMYKRYIGDLKTDINPLSSWMSNEAYKIGLNSEGTKILQYIFEAKLFDYPKPVSLIELLLSQGMSENDIVLDSFAGSGTTAHAVLNLNKDGGNRKFILIEMEDYADTVTAERVKRVMNGYAGKEGTGGSFDYYQLGEPLFSGENAEYLNEKVDIEKIKQYIWYTETRTAYLDIKDQHKSNHYLGKKDDTAYYFIYEKNEFTTLDYEMLSIVEEEAGLYIIYADNCLLPAELMHRKNIVFKKIPRDITRF